MNYNVELIKHPTEEDWKFCKMCTLNTVGKKSLTDPTDDWKIKLIESEHSPMRELPIAFKLEIPYYISTHFVRHHVGVSHYVATQRNDRQDNYDRTQAPQGMMVSHIISMNMQSFVHMCHARLCTQADPLTKSIVEDMVKLTIEANPEFESVLVPRCIYRNGVCTEFYPCGFNESIERK